MIRTHANSDFETMIAQLKTTQSQAEQFKKALRQEKKTGCSVGIGTRPATDREY